LGPYDVAQGMVMCQVIPGQAVKAVKAVEAVVVSVDDALVYSVALAYSDVRLVKPEKNSATLVPLLQLKVESAECGVGQFSKRKRPAAKAGL
jgi:hypothetical protein